MSQATTRIAPTSGASRTNGAVPLATVWASSSIGAKAWEGAWAGRKLAARQAGATSHRA